MHLSQQIRPLTRCGKNHLDIDQLGTFQRLQPDPKHTTDLLPRRPRVSPPTDLQRVVDESREVVTVLTSTWHERDAASLGFPVWAPAPDRPEDQLVPATRYAIGDSVFGMEAYPGREGQLDLVLWNERIRAVVAGDTLIDLGNGLEIAESWLPEGVTVEQVAIGLRPLLDKPVEFVLPTHGEPADRAALERALA